MFANQIITIQVIMVLIMIEVMLYFMFLHEIVSILIMTLFCRKKKRCQNRGCIFLMHCSKYSAPKPNYPPCKIDKSCAESGLTYTQRARIKMLERVSEYNKRKNGEEE